MSAIAANDRRILMFAALATGGMALGAFVWLWSQQGVAVYMNYLAGAAFTCL